MKPAEFVAGALDEIRSFPTGARQEAGHQIDQVQRGRDPDDWKPMTSVGPGVREIRIHREGEHRVIYVAKFEEAVYVVHAFQKKSAKTPKKSLEIAKRRYRDLVNQRRQK